MLTMTHRRTVTIIQMYFFETDLIALKTFSFVLCLLKSLGKKRNVNKEFLFKRKSTNEGQINR
jgi:hypothetical protein